MQTWAYTERLKANLFFKIQDDDTGIGWERKDVERALGDSRSEENPILRSLAVALKGWLSATCPIRLVGRKYL